MFIRRLSRSFQETRAMDLSIIIVTYNSKKFIQRCINSLLASLPNLAREIIVVDNASQDGSIDLVRKDFPEIKLISNIRNLGYAKACNQGIKEAKGRYIFILNPDTGLSEGSLEGMIKFMDEHHRYGILGPKLLDKDGKMQFSCRAFPSYSTAFFNRYSLLTKIFPKSKYAERYLKTSWPHDSIQETDWVSGAAMLIRKDCLNQIGNFDEDFFMYCEDIDICQRAKKNGWQVFYYPCLAFTHFIGGSIRNTSHLTIIWHHRSIWRYYKKYLKANIFWDAFFFVTTFTRAILLSCSRFIGNFLVLHKNRR